MDLVLVGLPGSGKSAVGRRLAARHDAASSTSTRRSRPRPASGSPRSSRRKAKLDSARASERRWPRSAPRPRAGGQADHRDRWRRGRRSAQSLVALPGPDRHLARRRPRGAGPAAPAQPQPATAPRRSGSDRDDPRAGRGARALLRCRAPDQRAGPGRGGRRRGRGDRQPARRQGTVLLDAPTPIGRLVLGEGIAGEVLVGQLARLRRRSRARRVRARRLGGRRPGDQHRPRGCWPAARLGMFPQGEAAKRLA